MDIINHNEIDEYVNAERIFGYEKPNIDQEIYHIIDNDKRGIRALCKRYMKEFDVEIGSWTIRKRKYTSREWVHRLWCDWNIEKLLTKRKQYERWLLRASSDSEKSRDGIVTREMIERAKAVPCTAILEMPGDVARCPWHSERTPSLKYYRNKNHVHCFGCGKHGDSIALAMQVWGVGFREAVLRLTGSHA